MSTYDTRTAAVAPLIDAGRLDLSFLDDDPHALLGSPAPTPVALEELGTAGRDSRLDRVLRSAALTTAGTAIAAVLGVLAVATAVATVVGTAPVPRPASYSSVTGADRAGGVDVLERRAIAADVAGGPDVAERRALAVASVSALAGGPDVAERRALGCFGVGAGGWSGRGGASCPGRLVRR